MNDLTHADLERLVTQALERTAFVLADPCDDDDDSLLTHHAQIDFTGPQSGQVRVSASDGFLAELASSLLGVERDEVDVATQGEDALRELANIMGGSILNEIGGATSTFRLGLPAIVKRPPSTADAVATCRLESEGHPLFVVWSRAA